MKVAVIGSRNIMIDNIGDFLPDGTTELVSGGAAGVDTCAKKYAVEHGIRLTEFLPDYKRYKRGAPLKRNMQIIEYADTVIAFWDGRSRGTEHVINECKRSGKGISVYIISGSESAGK